MNRRQFIRTTAATALLTRADALRTFRSASAEPLPTWSFPDLKTVIPNPVLIRSVELLRTQGDGPASRMMLVVQSADGVRGITQCNERMTNLTSLLKGLVLPYFVGKDARDLLHLRDNAYGLNSNYKYAGMPLWNCIGSVEIALWDLLGQTTRQPAYRFLGQPVRTDYPVYISSFDRSNPEKALDALVQKMTETGATGVKIKLGGRLRNTPEDDARTRKLIPLARKRLGDETVIYADANGSFTPQEGIFFGRMLEDYGGAILEEPCNFEDEDGIREVNAALQKIVLAGGEQDTSLYRFRRLVQTGVYDLLQPDLYYNGGIVRALQVAEIARAGGRMIAPHTPKADPLIGPFWQFAAVCPNLYGLQEYPIGGQASPGWYTPSIDVRNGRIRISDGPGLGIRYDAGIWKNAERIL